MTAVRREPNQQVVPRPRSSAGRSGCFCFSEGFVVATETRTTTENSAADSGQSSGMAPVYRPTEVEPRIYQRWLDDPDAAAAAAFAAPFFRLA